MPRNQASKSAKILYRPIGLLASVVGGLIASQIFKQVWKRATPYGQGEDHAPKALSTAYPLKQILIASVFQGAIYALVKTLTDRGGARLFEGVTGKWPGD